VFAAMLRNNHYKLLLPTPFVKPTITEKGAINVCSPGDTTQAEQKE
jgi:hypothetical protein